MSQTDSEPVERDMTHHAEKLRGLNDRLLMTGNDYSDVLLPAAAEIDQLRDTLTAIAKHRLRGRKTQAALLAESALRGAPGKSEGAS